MMAQRAGARDARQGAARVGAEGRKRGGVGGGEWGVSVVGGGVYGWWVGGWCMRVSGVRGRGVGCAGGVDEWGGAGG